jgi:hypothetical protein
VNRPSPSLSLRRARPCRLYAGRDLSPARSHARASVAVVLPALPDRPLRVAVVGPGRRRSGTSPRWSPSARWLAPPTRSATRPGRRCRRSSWAPRMPSRHCVPRTSSARPRPLAAVRLEPAARRHRCGRGRLARARCPRARRRAAGPGHRGGRDVATAPHEAGDVALAIAEGRLTAADRPGAGARRRDRRGHPVGRPAAGLQERRHVLAGPRAGGSSRAHGGGRPSLSRPLWPPVSGGRRRRGSGGSGPVAAGRSGRRRRPRRSR